MQTHNALQSISKEGKGVFVFMRQQMDSAQLLEKLSQYEQLAKEGNLEKFELHTALGQKDFGVGAQILRELGVEKIKLLTNHPRKRTGFIGFGLEIVENIEI